ncbi:gluconate 2-dehydrogenase subunit 3 family protein [Halogeometricum limi]|uniref:Gluconate 2-dehydrogenase subunit 3 n=1 Tax=Halogeometricum limi TaxID=555875 RepID=A0A1I6GM89_9EURY|nr:gluconate 2-dehydrogenase subunit 3 family protein [Halogeometricum limi]SFR43251.1 Gluconate 2-dehydrogenase subunit 3 [Halogeometricum limi]
MKLTRRDAVVALAAVGGVGASSVAARFDAPRAGDGDWDGAGADASAASADLLDVMDAAAAAVFPSDVDGRRTFVERYVVGRTEDRASYREGLTETAAELDAIARDWRDAAFADLSVETRDEILRGLGVETADPEPDGTVSERIRFYVVNDLLYAFYSTPTGGRLVGIENPVGYPGGTESYQRATMPDAGADGTGEEEETDG